MNKRWLLAVPLIAGCFSMTACDDDGPLERAGEKVDDAAEEVGDKLEDVGDDVEDAVDDADDE